MADWSLQDAKNKFSAVVTAAQKGQPQRVTRHGKPAVVVISADEYERLQLANAIAAPSFVEFLLAIPRSGDRFERQSVTPRDVAP